jgi:AraC-like DNA-binding protein
MSTSNLIVGVSNYPFTTGWPTKKLGDLTIKTVVPVLPDHWSPYTPSKEDAMATEEYYVRSVAERGTPLLLLSAETLHWDGIGAVTQCWRPPEDAVPAPPALHCPLSAPMGTGDPGRGAPIPAIEWASRAAPLAVYLSPVLLANAAHAVIPGVTGTLVWLSREGQEVSHPSTRHPALLVQTASASLQRGCVELRLHLPADDPLHHHMNLVLQVTYAAACRTSRLYAEALADALAVHFLRRYAACGDIRHEVSGGLSPAKLQRVLAYIQAHLEQELALTTLANVVQLSPDHFARLFKQATGQPPHQYVLQCRIERAKQLLAETDMPLSMIGLEVGCTDHSAFTALFRKHVTMTPKVYRAAIQMT